MLSEWELGGGGGGEEKERKRKNWQEYHSQGQDLNLVLLQYDAGSLPT